MVGLLIIFSLAAAATFGLFLFRHAEKAALREQQTQLAHEVKWLREYNGRLEAELPPLDNRIAAHRVLAETLAKSDAQAVDDTGRLVSQNQIHVKAIEEAVNKQIKTYQDLLKDAKERRSELAQEETRAFANERDFDDRRATLRSKIEVISQEIEGVKKKGRRENAELDSRVVQLEDRVRELTQQRELNNKELRPDGQLLQAAASDGFVILNIGQRHNLRKGTRFTVYNRRAGKVNLKGVVEVTRVEEQIATARVLEETDHNDPLLANDFIANPVYSPDKVKGFAIRGDFNRYSKDELKRFIIENGGRYDDELSVNTDYLVAGDRSDAALQQAIKLGISILSEEQLIESQLFRLPDGAKQ
jgi:NAD-dependent DNA ligase